MTKVKTTEKSRNLAKEMAKQKNLILSNEIETVTNIRTCFDVCDTKGYKYKISIEDIIKNQELPKPIAKFNPYTIENIKNYLRLNQISTKILSNTFKGSGQPLLWECGCGRKFERSWNNFTRKTQICPTCSKTIQIKTQREQTFKLIKQECEQRGYILLTTDYNGPDQYLEYICSKHKDKGVQKIKAKFFLHKKQGCKYCALEKRSNKKRVPEAELRLITEKVGFIYDHVEYKSSNIPGKRDTLIYYICPHHKDKGLQSTTLNIMRKASGKCGYCLGKKRTHEDFINMMEGINPNIAFLSQYETATGPIKCKCKVDGYEWVSTGNDLLHGKGCKICAHKKTAIAKHKTHEQFENEIIEKFHGKISLISQYTGIYDTIQCKCTIDGTIWETTATSLLHSTHIACPTCIAKQIREKSGKSNQDFINELKLINPHILPLESYQNMNTKILCECQLHKYQWKASPRKLLTRKTGCPKCTSYQGEKLIDDILTAWGYNFTMQKTFPDCKDIKVLPFDRYLDDFNILIEYDGEGHFMPIPYGSMTQEQSIKVFHMRQRHDEIKNKYCLDHHIPLIRIPYWEKENMECFIFDKLVEYGAIELVS